MRSGGGVSGDTQVTWGTSDVEQVTWEQVTGDLGTGDMEWHVTGHVVGQVTSQVIGHVIKVDKWLVM